LRLNFALGHVSHRTNQSQHTKLHTRDQNLI